MPSFTSRRYVPDRFRSLTKEPEDDVMVDIVGTTPATKDRSSLTLGPSDGSLLDYFDLPSPPSTPQRPTHSMSYSSLNSFPSPAINPDLAAARSSPSSLSSLSSTRTSRGGSPTSSPPTPSLPRWPTASQRIHRLSTRPRSRSASSVSSSGSSTTLVADPDVDMIGADSHGTGTTTVAPLIRTARRTPYYPPNSSRNVDRTRVYMNRGPHFVPNWTPLSSLPRHVQLQIEERMVRFTAL